MNYRPDIDGLRAFAVLSVVAFHINPGWLPGGFAGVDVFFVISGYLITRIIAEECSLGRFSFAEFYRRRLKRIMPAMFLVTACTWAAGMLLLLPKDMVDLSWSAIFTALSAANIYFTFFLDTGYFADDSATVPLLHMWSLGIEEQFYLLWPALLIALLKAPRLVVPALLLIIAASIAIGEWQLDAGAFKWAYYMLPARAFQLGAGGLLVFLAAPKRPFALPASGLGVVLCAWSVLFLNGESLFPGLRAVPITFGTALLIWTGAVANPVAALLAFRPLRSIGLISYSLYLWHWPVLAFQRYLYSELTLVQQIGSLAAMLLLSAASFHWVEQPARRSSKPFAAIALRFLAAPGIVLLGLCLWTIGTSGFGPLIWTDYPKTLAALGEAKPAVRSRSVCQAALVTPELLDAPRCRIGQDGTATVLLWGDSNAAHFVGFLGEIAGRHGVTFRNIAHSACPPVSNSPGQYGRPDLAENCNRSSAAVRAIIPRFGKVIIAASWDSYLAKKGFLGDLRETILKLRQDGAEVMILGRVPRIPRFDWKCEQKRIRVPSLECVSEAPRNRTDRTNEEIRKVAREAGAGFYAPTDLICGGSSCSAYMDGRIIYFDSGHLTHEGSTMLGRKAAALPPSRLDEFLAE